MEQWQRRYITKNLPFFIENIQYDTMLRAVLLSEDCLSREDDEKLEISGGNLKTSCLLLNILQFRSNGYQALARSLLKTNQSGALLKLLQGVEENVVSVSAFDYCDVKVDPNLFCDIKIKLGRKEVFIVHLLPDKIDIHSFVEPILDALTYEQILNKKPLTVLSSTVPDKLKYYIPRSVLLYCKLKQNAFVELTDAIFLFEGLEQFQLTQIALSTKELRNTTNVLLTDVSTNQLLETSVHFILLLHSSHFETIAMNTGKCAYWVKYSDNEYFLVKSAGLKSVSRIRPHMESMTFTEGEFATKYTAQHTGKHVILSDSPGMGKSMLLEEISRRLELENNNDIVLTLHASKLANIREINGRSPCGKEIYLTVSAEYTKNEFGKKLLKKLLDTNRITVHLLLDAFDELDENQKKSFVRNLQVLLPKYSCIRIIVTSRMHGLSDLETLFGCLGHQILPFQKPDQILFVLEYWKEKHGIVPAEHVHQFALRCLQTWESKASSHELKITGIPLQCRMLAELHMKEALTILKNPKYSSTFSSGTGSLMSLYTNYISKGLTNVEDEQEYLNYHIYKALTLLVPRETHDTVYNSKFSFCEDTIYKIGIMEKNSMGQEQFVHRTFAEFLVAKYFSEVLQTGQYVQNLGDTERIVALVNTLFEIKDIEQKVRPVVNTNPLFVDLFPERDIENLLTRKQTRFVNNTIIFFLNQHFRLANKGLVSGSHLKHFATVVKFPISTICKWVVACVVEKFEEIFKVICSVVSNSSNVYENLSKTGLDKILYNNVSHMDLIISSAQYSSGKTFKTIWEMPSCSKSHERISLAILVAVLVGNYEVFEYLLNYNKHEILNQTNILWTCIRVTNISSIEEKLQILKLLLKQAPDLISQPAFLEVSSNFSLIKELIDAGVNLEARTNQKYSIAHTAAYYCSADEYHELVHLLIERGKQFLFREKSSCILRLTPLFEAMELRRVEILPATLELLVRQCNLSFHNFISTGETELYGIIRRALSSSVWKNNLKILIGLQVNISDYCLRNTLYALTPLSIAVENKNESLVRILLNGGANVNKPKWIYYGSKTPCTLLNIAKNAGNRVIIRMLVDAKIHVPSSPSPSPSPAPGPSPSRLGFLRSCIPH